MYVLQLDARKRDYLLSLLKAQRESRATRLAALLRTADDAFGVVMWTNDDIASRLKREGVPVTAKNIRAVRDSYHCRHIDDQMVEDGWSALEDAVLELKPR